MKNLQSSRLGFWVLVLIAIFGAAYLVQAVNLSTKGYEIGKLQKIASQLEDSNKKLQREASSMKSIENLQDQVRTLNLVPSKIVDYPKVSNFTYNN